MPDFPSRLNAAVDKSAGQLETDFLKSVRVTVKETDWQKLEQDLQAYQDGDAIIDGVAWEDYDPRERLKSLFSVILDLHGAEIGAIIGGAKFDYVDPKALEWIDKYCADDIKFITDSQKAAIKSIVKDGYENGVTPQQQAREIRAHIGLDEARSASLQKYTDDLFSKGKSEAEVWRLVEARGKEYLNARALTISLNETSEAAGRATYQSTASAVERGVLDPNLYEAYRIITPDERLCTVCNGVAGEARKLPDGTYPSSGDTIAKKHTRCRCVEGLREVSMKKKEMKESGKTWTDIVFEARALKRKDGVIYCPTVPLVEGVFEGLGFPVLRLYEEFSKDAKWLNGLTVLTNHEDLTPNARRIGQISDTQARPEKKDVAATTQFFESDLTPKEVDAITSKQSLHGSLSLSYNLENTSGDYDGKHYEAIERGPYCFFEYSLVRQGIVTPEDGAGFNVECQGCKSKSHSKSSAHGAVTGDTTMSGESAGHEPEVKESIDALKVEFESIKTEFAAIKEENKTLKGTIEADKKARVFEMFQGKLKPGHLAEAEKLFEAYQKDPASWVMENAGMFIQPTKERKLMGSAIVGEGAAQTFDLAKEQDKLFGRSI